MPRLPSVDVIERPIARPSRAVVSYQPVSVSPGVAALPYEALARTGQAVADLGLTIDGIQQRLAASRRAAILGEAVAQATTKLSEMELAFERDPDFRTAPQRFGEQAAALRQSVSDGIADDAVKRAFGQRFDGLATAKRLNVLKFAAKQEGDATVARLDEDLDGYATAAVNARSVAERALVVNEAAVRIAETRDSGWITEVDAGKRARAFEAKLAGATVTRDMALDPGGTATKLASDPEYAAALDSERREKLIDSGWRQAEAARGRAEAAERKRAGDAADEALGGLFALHADGRLSRPMIESKRSILIAGGRVMQYEGLLNALKRKGGDQDDDAAYADIQASIDAFEPDDAVRKAFRYQAEGKIRNSVLGDAVSKANAMRKREGVKTPAEIYGKSISDLVSEFDTSMVKRSRVGFARRDFDLWVLERTKELGREPPREEMAKKAQEVINSYAVISMDDMQDITGVGKKGDAKATLEDIRAEIARLKSELDAGRISSQRYNQRITDLDRQREEAERASRGR